MQKKEYKYLAYEIEEDGENKVVRLDQKGYNNIKAYLVKSDYIGNMAELLQHVGFN